LNNAAPEHCALNNALGVALVLQLLKDNDPALSGDHVREGLSGVISVKVPSPEFEGQTKTRLGNPEVSSNTDFEPQRCVAAVVVCCSCMRAIDVGLKVLMKD